MNGRSNRAGTPLLALVFLAAVLFPPPAAAGTGFHINGYFKNFSTAIDRMEYDGTGDAPGSATTGSVSNRLRIAAYWNLSRSISLECACDFTTRIQDRSLYDGDSPLLQPDPLTYRIGDLRSRIYPENESDLRAFAISQNLDRALLTISLSSADILVGRQAIAWGSARAVNPTDVLAPFAFNELDTEDRTGIDAIRIRIPTGMMGEIDLGFVSGKDARFERSALYARTKFYIEKTDVTLMAVGFRENLLAGLDLARSIGGAGAWLECAAVFVDALRDGGREHTRNYGGITCGIDYNLTATVYGFVEYHLNGAGSEDTYSYLANTGGPAYREGALYLLGRHYLAPGVTWQVTPLAGFSAQTLWNLTDTSLLFAPRLEYSLAEDIFFDAGCFLGLGQGASTGIDERGNAALLPDSEFGLYPDLYYTSFRIYF